MTTVKIGALCWNQYTDWPSLLEAGIRADRLGYTSLWTWDHLYPIVGDSHGPNYEGWLDDHRLGAGHEAGPHRPDGRRQHDAQPRRSWRRWRPRSTTSPADAPSSGSAAHGSRRSTATSASTSAPASRSGSAGWARPCRSCGACWTAPSRRRGATTTTPRNTRNLPRPVQAHLPICIGGGGEKVTLKLVARYGDMCNIGGGLAAVAAQGGDPAGSTARPSGETPTRSSGRRTSASWSSATTAPRRSACSTRRSTATGLPATGRTSPWARRRTWPRSWPPTCGSGTGTWSRATRRLYDEESMTRYATEVRPLLEQV